MTIIIFYSIAIVLGFILLYIYNKYFENRKVYYIAWAVSLLVLSTISPIMNESVFYIFDSENYKNVDSWLLVFYFLFLLVPTSFLLYPIVKGLRWLYGSFEEFFESIMLLFVSKKRKIKYFESKEKQQIENK